MTVALATLNGVAITDARVQVGAWGTWWADVTLTDPVDMSGHATLVIADLTLKGTIVVGGVAHGAAGYRIVGGAGGLSKVLPSKAYANDAGVKASQVISDAAREAGETVSGAPATLMGPHFVRVGEIASRVLNDVAPKSWRVDFDGVIRFGLLPPQTYTGNGARTRVDPQGAIIDIATEKLAGLVPGVVVDGAAPATDVEYRLNSDRLTARVFAGPKKSRRLEALSAVVAAMFPAIRWAGTYEFRVVAQSGERFALQAVRKATGLPDLANVPVRGPAGVKAVVTPGELVLVAFVDSDPSRPVIMAHDAPDAPGWMPLFLQLGQSPALGVARITDPVQAGPFSGVITFASTRIKAGL